MTYKRYFLLLSFILLAKAAFLIGFIAQNYIGLGPDEAQYWTWSQHLDWGYYSKPPGIAWQIGLTSYLLGNTELGVRFGAVFIGSALPIAVFFLAKASCLQPKTSFWASLIMAFAPMGLMASFLSITDGGLVLFWTLGCIIIVSALSSKTSPNYYLLSLMIICGALFKWLIYYLWIITITTSFFVPRFRTKHLLAGLVLSIVGLLPSLFWNVAHDWVTFKHVAGNITGAPSSNQAGNFWAFLGEQAALLSPLLFLILIFSYVHQIRYFKNIPSPLNFCGFSSLIFILSYSVLAIFKKIQGNWCDFVYPMAIIYLCWYAFEKVQKGQFWIKFGLGLSMLLSVCLFSLPLIQSKSLVAAIKVPYKINPFRHNVGGLQLLELLTKLGYQPAIHFLFSDKYQTSSLLSFYSPGQKQAYFLNLNQIRLNQFSFWPSMADEQKGKSGFFVIIENSPHKEKNFPVFMKSYLLLLQPYFKTVTYLGEYSLFDAYGQSVKAAQVYKCEEYNGKLPPKVNLY